jgi:Flp pilus assembly protein TadG
MTHDARRTMLANLKAFWRDTRGTYAVIFGLAVTPIVMMGGSAVDFAMATKLKSMLQQRADAAVLASCRKALEKNVAVADVRAAGVQHFNEHRPPGSEVVSLEPSVIPGQWRLDAKGTYETAFMRLALVNSIEVNVFATCESGVRSLEVALVLDNTGSMASNNRIGALRTAALDLVNILEAANAPNRPVKVSVVPFVTSVNVKGEGFSMDWIDQTAAAPHHGENFELEGGNRVNHFTLFNRLGVEWKGCVEARPTPHNISDTAPDPLRPETLFVPYFAPDEPGNAAAAGNSSTDLNNSYLNDMVSGDHFQRQRSLTKYAATTPNTIDPVGPLTNGPNRACPTPIVPLTQDFEKVRNSIRGMIEWNGSGTNVSEGLAWGWRVLSPGAPYTQGSEFNNQDVSKVVVLLTDGENVVFGSRNSPNRSDYGSYGFAATGRFGTQDQTLAARRVDEWTLNLCTELKNRGVDIFTITLQADTPANRTLYTACANSAANYFPTNDVSALSGVFRSIGNRITNMRLVN